MYKGPFIRTSAKFLGFWTPSPLVRILARSIRVNPRNLPYYVCFWANPPSPLSADVLYEWSPRIMEYILYLHVICGGREARVGVDVIQVPLEAVTLQSLPQPLSLRQISKVKTLGGGFQPVRLLVVKLFSKFPLTGVIVT